MITHSLFLFIREKLNKKEDLKINKRDAKLNDIPITGLYCLKFISNQCNTQS